MLVDTHCHIDRYPDPMSLAAECEAKGITAIAVTNLPSHYEMAASHIGNLRYVKPALGFHPLAVAENRNELPRFLRLLEAVRFVGEVGLDYSREGTPSKQQQLEVFQAIAEALSSKPRFVTLHSRGSAEDVVDILAEHKVTNCVFHWYSGTLSTLDRVVAGGHYVSINTAMLASKKGRSVLERVPRERILTETDGPYVKIGRAAAKPTDTKQVLQGMGDVWDLAEEDVEMLITGNYQELCASLGILEGGAPL